MQFWNSSMPFSHHYTVRFRDTDAAGVVYFANVLAICHEAYEASLAASGIEARSFFRHPSAAVPIVHASVDFLRPVSCGDRLIVQLIPRPLPENSFEIAYEIFADPKGDRPLAKALTRHVCIDPDRRKRRSLPVILQNWLDRWHG
jgi:1,4-dihydroxy-2-naphthoyl-CoA hydrolase